MKLFLGICLLILAARTPHLITPEASNPPVPRIQPKVVPPTVSLLPTITPDMRENK